MNRVFVSAALAAVIGACGSSPARFPTSDPSVELLPRRAPGVAVDPAPRLPGAVPGGSVDEGLLVLTSPRDLGQVKDLVARFFRALVSESPAELDLLLADQAFIDTSGGRQPARALYRSRFSQLDYSALRGLLVYRERDVEIYAADAARTLEAARGVPSDLSPDQIFVRVHVAASHAGKTRVLPDELSLLLRPSTLSFEILRIAENTAIP